MARLAISNRRVPGRPRRRQAAALAIALAFAPAIVTLLAGTSGASRAKARTRHLAVPAAQRAWCTSHGAAFAGWTGGPVDLPICGPGPAYGGTLAYVDLPGPHGSMRQYFNATPGFQCVELAERWLAVVDGLAPVRANGSTVAAAYHAAYPASRLVHNGSLGAVGHPPVAGDVISFSTVPSFEDPTGGHVAVVVASAVDRATGDGVVQIAQEDVSASDYRMTLRLSHWRLYDPSEPANAALQYPYAEWFQRSATPPAGR